jgi:hypothetical protein
MYYQVGFMRKWLRSQKVKRRLSVTEFTYIAQELEQNPVGLSGNGIIMVNYSLASSVG